MTAGLIEAVPLTTNLVAILGTLVPMILGLSFFTLKMDRRQQATQRFQQDSLEEFKEINASMKDMAARTIASERIQAVQDERLAAMQRQIDSLKVAK